MELEGFFLFTELTEYTGKLITSAVSLGCGSAVSCLSFAVAFLDKKLCFTLFSSLSRIVTWQFILDALLLLEVA